MTDKINLPHPRCRGCADTFGNFPCNSTPSVTINGELLRCPCQTCIIKTMCKKACKEFNNYTKLIKNDEWEEWEDNTFDDD